MALDPIAVPTVFRRLAFGLALMLAGVLATGSQAADPPKPPKPLEFAAERLVVFKDGHCLVVKKAKVPEGTENFAFTDDVPDAAVLGSFWAAPDEGRLASMAAAWVEDVREEPREFVCSQPLDLLVANKGREARIVAVDQKEKEIVGVIQDVLGDKTKVPLAEPGAPPRRLSQTVAFNGQGYRPVPPPGMQVDASGSVEKTSTVVAATHCVIRTDEGDVMLPIASIHTLRIKDMTTKLTRTVTTKTKTKRITFRFATDPKTGKTKRPKEIQLMYFRPGVRWVPTYKVDLGEGGEKPLAQMRLQAEILNEAEDIEDVPVDLVVGVPNLRFKDHPSPFSLESTMRNALAHASQHLGNNRFQMLNNSIMSQQAAFNVDPGAAGGGASIPEELASLGAQDLFVYKLPKLTLLRGERTGVDILSAEVPYRHVHTWDVSMRRTPNDAAPGGAGSPLILSTNNVWHQIVMTNPGDVPWTTGSVMFTQGDQPLAQDMLTYTPPKGSARVPLTVAIDVQGTTSETEKKRDLNAVSWDGYHYAKVAKQGEVRLRNAKRESIDIEVTLRTGGKATESSDEGKIAVGSFRPEDWENYQGSHYANNSSTIVWRTKLEPGKTFSPTFDYFYFVRQ